MIVYKAAYTFDDSDNEGWVCGQVLDFPGAISQGRGLEDARRMLGSALVDMAETHILQGDPLPQPDSSLTDPDADLMEPIYLLLDGAAHIRVVSEDIPA
jgi:predicted RNase H-like HicB family nuclease